MAYTHITCSQAFSRLTFSLVSNNFSTPEATLIHFTIYESFDRKDHKMKPTEIWTAKALGLGFDLASDFRLKFVKKCPNGGILVILDEKKKRDVVIPRLEGFTIPNVPDCIRVDKGDHIRFKFDVLQFNLIERIGANADHAELEKEGVAAATAAEEAMSMIFRLQNEKSLTNQYRR